MYTDADARFDAEQQGRCPLCGRYPSEGCNHCPECGMDMIDGCCTSCEEADQEWEAEQAADEANAELARR